MSEHYTVGEELLSSMSEMDFKCMVINKAVNEKYFSFEMALIIFKVNRKEYFLYEEENISHIFNFQKNNDAPVNLTTAIYLKEKGFNKTCEFYYLTKDMSFNPSGLKSTKNGRKMNHNRFDDFIYSAPLVKDAKKWLKL